MILNSRFQSFIDLIKKSKSSGFYPYFQPIDRSWGPEVESRGKRLIMIGSNDYLGFSHDPRVMEAAVNALHRMGTGPGGSRFLSGNMTLHEELEERLADFVGKKRALLHTTGFQTNLGAIASLITGGDDPILCDREDHASIFEGCKASRGRVIPFDHNSAADAAKKLAAAREKRPEACLFMITEGVFSMSGDVGNISELVALKKDFPDMVFYLDDAHGLGVMGRGRGTAAHFDVLPDVDFIMGTFSKAMASIGGFIASDDTDVLEYLKHQSKTMIFSAGLPAASAATVLKCIELIEQEPDRVDRLWETTERVRQGYKDLGLCVGASQSPVIPICIGDEDKAFQFSYDLYQEGIFALPAIFPAVPRGKAIIRTAYMSTHEEHHIERVMEVLDKLARKHHVREFELVEQGSPVVEDLKDRVSDASVTP